MKPEDLVEREEGMEGSEGASMSDGIEDTIDEPL